MAEIKILDPRDTTIGDAAIDGLAGGVVGGILMVVYLEIAGLLMGAGLGEMLSRFNQKESDPLLVAFVLHLAVAGVYGILYGILYRWIALYRKGMPDLRISAVSGAVYGILLLILARSVLLPSTGPALVDVPLLHFGIAHLIFGISNGLLSYRSWVNAV
jgi:hypothetical protein